MYEKVKTYSIAAVAVAVLGLTIWKVMPGGDGDDAAAAGTTNLTPDGASRAVTPADIALENPGESRPEVLNIPKTSITFEEAMWDFGEVIDGDQVKHTFKFKNTGNNPLVISNAQAGCGCTVPSWPKEPIQPGEDGEIVVAYNSTNKVGFKTVSVTVTANTDPPDTNLKIQANVLAKDGEGESEDAS